MLQTQCGILDLSHANSDARRNNSQPLSRPQLWYLQEWFANQGKIQRTLVTELGWLPAKANKVWHGIQEPKPSEMHEIANYLNIRPHELMMHPDDAMRIHRLEAAVREVAKDDLPTPVSNEPPKRQHS